MPKLTLDQDAPPRRTLVLPMLLNTQHNSSGTCTILQLGHRLLSRLRPIILPAFSPPCMTRATSCLLSRLGIKAND